MTLRDRLRAGDIALMTAVLADATNLGLARMAWSSGVFSHTQLLWTAEWHLRDETYQAALACQVDAIHAQTVYRSLGRRRNFLLRRAVLQGWRPRRGPR